MSMDVLLRIKRLVVAQRVLLFVIESPTFGGTWVYTKGTFRRVEGQEVFYVFVSTKLAD